VDRCVARDRRAALSREHSRLKYAGGLTIAAITPCDLMTRLYIYADDTMLGREVGTEAHLKPTAYIPEREVRGLGLKPARDSGRYFQNLPVVVRSFDTTSTMTVAGATYRAIADFVATTPGKQRPLTNVSSVFIDAMLGTLSVLPESRTKGKVLIVLPPAKGVDPAAIEATPGFQRWYQMYLSGAGRVTVVGAQMYPQALMPAIEPRVSFANSESRIEIVVTDKVAEAMLGAPLRTVGNGALGETVTTAVRFVDQPRPGRNVLAIPPGSDPKRRGEYVAVGAHNDHLVPADSAVDHDSVKIFNIFVRPQGADCDQGRMSSPDEWKRIKAMIDSLHKVHAAPGRTRSSAAPTITAAAPFLCWRSPKHSPTEG
jgi:hypothetical protein